MWRSYLVYMIILILGIFIFGKAFYIQTVEGGYWKSLSDSLHLEYREIDAERGSILSEDGRMLSSSIPFLIYTWILVQKVFRKKMVNDSRSMLTAFPLNCPIFWQMARLPITNGSSWEYSTVKTVIICCTRISASINTSNSGTFSSSAKTKTRTGSYSSKKKNGSHLLVCWQTGPSVFPANTEMRVAGWLPKVLDWKKPMTVC